MWPLKMRKLSFHLATKGTAEVWPTWYNTTAIIPVPTPQEMTTCKHW